VIAIVVVFAAVVYGSVTYLVPNPHTIADLINVVRFKPTAAIDEQIHRDDMTGHGRFLYLASEPTVEPRRQFNQICSAVTTDTGVLGCYIDATKRIYIFHETDKRVDGTEEVMAAHEMLRAAWDRMTPAQRAPLLVQLNNVLYKNDDPNLYLSDSIAAARRDDPHDSNAELYATIGTEVPSVGKVLEASYAQFFVKRSIVTALNAHAISYIVALRHKVAKLSSTMTKLNDTITARIKSFNAAATRLRSDVASFNSRANTLGGFASEGQFNVGRAALIARQNSLKSTAMQINAQIDTFNADLTVLNGYLTIALSLATSLNIDFDFEPIQHVISA
jgi:hypothetical protein